MELLTDKVRYLGSASYILLVSCSLIINLIVLLCFIKLRKQLSQIIFFTVAWQMLISDYLNLFVQISLVIPESLAGVELYPKWLVYSIGFIDTLGLRACLFFSFYMTINRLAIFVFPKLNELLFKKKQVFWGSMLFIWMLAIAYCAFVSFAGCNKGFDVQNLSTTITCPTDTILANLAKTSRSFIVGTLPLIMLAIYLVIFLKLQIMARWHGIKLSKPNFPAQNSSQNQPQNVKPSKREMSFFFQSVIICGVLELEGLAYDNLHYFEISGEFKILPQILQMWMTVVSCTLHSIVILSFNSKIKDAARQILRAAAGLKPRSSIVSISNNGPRSSISVSPSRLRSLSLHK